MVNLIFIIETFQESLFFIYNSYATHNLSEFYKKIFFNNASE
jgi:hypothetical protein